MVGIKYRGRYKEYNKKYNKKYRQDHREYFREYQREYMKEYQKKYPEGHRKSVRNWQRDNPEKHRIHRRIYKHPELYPLEDECEFCGATENLEHAHYDYEDEGRNYVTACHQCNRNMELD